MRAVNVSVVICSSWAPKHLADIQTIYYCTNHDAAYLKQQQQHSSNTKNETGRNSSCRGSWQDLLLHTNITAFLNEIVTVQRWPLKLQQLLKSNPNLLQPYSEFVLFYLLLIMLFVVVISRTDFLCRLTLVFRGVSLWFDNRESSASTSMIF